MIDETIRNALAQKVNRSWDAYADELRQLDQEALIQQAKDIALTEACKDELVAGHCSQDIAEYLLRFQDPLTVVSEQMRTSTLTDISVEFDHILWEIRDKGDAEQD